MRTIAGTSAPRRDDRFDREDRRSFSLFLSSHFVPTRAGNIDQTTKSVSRPAVGLDRQLSLPDDVQENRTTVRTGDFAPAISRPVASLRRLRLSSAGEGEKEREIERESSVDGGGFYLSRWRDLRLQFQLYTAPRLK